MAYRKSYYRKDGTHVSSSFDRRNSRSNKKNDNFFILALIIALIGLLFKFIKFIFKGIKFFFIYFKQKFNTKANQNLNC